MKKAAVSPQAAQIAKGLHDGVCQTLTCAHLHLSMLARKVKETCPDCTAELAELQQMIDQARAELHLIVKEIPQ